MIAKTNTGVAFLKYVFLFTFLILVLVSLGTFFMEPELAVEGKTPLIWTSDDNPARREQIELFNQLYPEYQLRLDPGNVDMQKVIVQSLAGVGPDLFCCYGGFQLSAYVKSGIAWDVTDRLKEAGIDVEQDLWRGPDPTYIFEDKVYGFPTNAAVDAIWYNKDMFEGYGIEPPEGPLKWEQFIPLAQKLTVEKENGRMKHYGFLFSFNAWQTFIMQWGGSLYSEDGTRCTLDSPEAIAAIQFMHDLIYKYKVTPSPVEEAAMATQGGWGSGEITWFGGNKGAMALGGRWWLCILRDYENLRLGAFECPHQDKRVFLGYGKSAIINKNSPHREQAFNFLKYMSEKPYNDLINHQADALAPVKEYCYTDDYLHDPEFPDEDYNHVWRDIMEFGVPEQISPFVKGNVATRIITKQLDLVKNDTKSAADAMKTATEQINKVIQRTVERDPELRKQYERLTGTN